MCGAGSTLRAPTVHYAVWFVCYHPAMTCGLSRHKIGGFSWQVFRRLGFNDLVQLRLLLISCAHSGTLPPTFGHSARLQPTSVAIAYPALGRICVQLSDEPFLFRGANLHVLTIQQEQLWVPLQLNYEWFRTRLLHYGLFHIASSTIRPPLRSGLTR